MSYPEDVNKKYLKDRYQRQRAEFIQYLGGECRECGSKENLEIDHVRWQDKSFNVGALWPQNKLSRVYEELDKCQLLCQTCHRQKSRSDLSENLSSRGFTHGTIYAWMRKKCGCKECQESKAEWQKRRNQSRRAERKSEIGGSHRSRGPYGSHADHGETLMYNRGCRCEKCRRANSNHVAEWRRKKKREK